MAKNNKSSRGNTFVGFRPSVHSDGRDRIYKGGSYTEEDLKREEEELYGDDNDFSEDIDEIHKNTMKKFMEESREDAECLKETGDEISE